MNENEQENIDSQYDETDQQELETTEAEDDGSQDESQDTDDVAALKERNKQLFARAKKAEGFVLENGQWVKKPKSVQKEPTQKIETNQEPVFTREEAILIAKGFDEEDLETLHSIAKGKDISLKDAQEDTLFVAYQEKKKAEQKQKDAQLGASNGSGRTTQDKPKANMTAEEHRKFWSEKTGS